MWLVIGPGIEDPLTQAQERVIKLYFPELSISRSLTYKKIVLKNNFFTIQEYDANFKGQNSFLITKDLFICQNLKILLVGPTRQLIIWSKRFQRNGASTAENFQLITVDQNSELYSFSPDDILSKCIVVIDNPPPLILSALSNLIDKD